VVRLLLEHGADANALDVDNRTALHRVSELGRVGAARVLLEHGADVNARDVKNATPLHLAIKWVHDWYDDARGDYLGVARLLLRYGSDIHARDNEGRTPFMRAREKECHEIMALLLEHGAEDHIDHRV
ncbi:ankyrin repeat protein, partial [Russula aff. rugulosa BPL654]